MASLSISSPFLGAGELFLEDDAVGAGDSVALTSSGSVSGSIGGCSESSAEAMRLVSSGGCLDASTK